MSKNNKGFITIELIVVSVFILAIFAIIFVNSNLAFQAYDKKEYYDDIDTKYAGYYIKTYIYSAWETIPKKQALTNVDTGDEVVYQFSCDNLKDNIQISECKTLFASLEIKNVYITKFSLKTFKEYTRRDDIAKENAAAGKLNLPNANFQVVANTSSKENNDPNTVYMSLGMYDYIKQSPDYINNSNSDEIKFRLFIELESTYINELSASLTYNKYGTMELAI